MAEIKLNPMIRGISGKVGGIIYRTTKNGKVTASLAPARSTGDSSPAQKNQQQKMKQAQAYARAAMQHPELRVHYEQIAKRTRSHSSPRQLAVTDYLRGNDLLWQKLHGDQEKPADWSWDPEGAQLPSAPVTGTYWRNLKKELCPSKHADVVKNKDHEIIMVFLVAGAETCAKPADLKNIDH